MLEKIVNETKKIKKDILIYALAFASALPLSLTGCTSKYFQPRVNPIEKQSTEVIMHPDVQLNKDIINQDELLMYKDEYTTFSIQGNNFISYSPRNIEATNIKKIVEEQLPGSVGKISYTTGTNHLLIQLNKTSQTLETSIQDVIKLIRVIDKPIPQIMLYIEIYETYADFTKDRTFRAKLSPIKGTKGFSPILDVKDPGVLLSRAPEKLDMGNILGVIYEGDQGEFEARLDMLRSQGVAKTIIRSPVIFENGKSAEIQTVQEFPYFEETVAGGAILRANRFKEIKNYVKILGATVRADKRIAMDLELGTGTRVPTGSEQKYNIYLKTLKNSVEVGQGVKLVIAGFEYEIETGINRRMPFFTFFDEGIRKIPVVRELIDLVSSGHEYDTSRRRTFFLVTPYVVKTSQNADYSRIGMELKPMYRQDRGGILQFPSNIKFQEMQIPPVRD